MVEKEKENVGFRFLQPTILMSSSYSDSSGGVGISGSCFSPRMCRRCGAGKGVSEELPTDFLENMIVSALLMSVGINTALWVLFFKSYTILRKQPSYCEVYVPFLLAEGISKRRSRFNLERLIPSDIVDCY
ncbi:CSC1-like protein [Vigna angularis]|uniref:CSC1-like protein n=1 Tax=Phaseolus angularis TaxID=3914 RepID=A0A8T0JWH1_PHAAN|nr:CSC1-like protein [Vigna angularis]